MNKLRNLLLIQLLTGLLIGIAVATAGLFTVSKLLHSEQLHHKELIQQFSYSNLIDEPKLLSKQLKASIDFEFLTIKNREGHPLYSFTKSPTEMPVLTPILQQADLMTAPKTLASAEGSLLIEFHSSYDSILEPAFNALLVALFTPLLIVIISFILFRISMSQIFKQVAKDCAETIESITDELSKPELPTLPKQFDVIETSTKKLKAFFDNKLVEYENSASEIKTEAFKDSLTNLPNRTRFVEYFEENISQSDKPNQFGILLLLRATELQHINQSQGYQAGDKYVKGIADILINVVGTYSNASLYRLNLSLIHI